MRRALTSGAVVAILVCMSATASAAHYCTAATGTFIPLALPENPAAPERTHVYFHDRSRNIGICLYAHCDPKDDVEGLWVYVENGLRPGYNSGGVALAPVLNATGSADVPCGAVMSDDGLSATPKAGADDVVL